MAKVLTYDTGTGGYTAKYVNTAEVADGAITSAKLAANAVGSGHIADGAVDSAELAADFIDDNHIATGGVGSDSIANGAVDSAQLAADFIDDNHIATGGVGSDSIANGAVISAKIGATAIGSGHIADGAIISAKIGASAVGSGHVADGSLTSSDLSPSFISDLLGAEAVGYAGRDAGEPLSANMPVAVNSSGYIVPAQAITTGEYPAVGITTAAVASGSSCGSLYGINDEVDISGSVAAGNQGSILWLSTTAGEFAASPPSTSGDIQQRLGVIVTDTAAIYHPDLYGVEIN